MTEPKRKLTAKEEEWLERYFISPMWLPKRRIDSVRAALREVLLTVKEDCAWAAKDWLEENAFGPAECESLSKRIRNLDIGEGKC